MGQDGHAGGWVGGAAQAWSVQPARCYAGRKDSRSIDLGRTLLILPAQAGGSQKVLGGRKPAEGLEKARRRDHACL